jgi:hypothetical protein
MAVTAAISARVAARTRHSEMVAAAGVISNERKSILAQRLQASTRSFNII